MTSIALARKWRPQTFEALMGQDHVSQALTHSLSQQRLHHAYLFTGTRGVGKTSIARLLAKALNCEQGISAYPCLKCDTCIAIEQGHYIDLIEIDAASKTRVEDTRELLDNVPYAPAAGRYKVYLIDEVHMLSQHSFNALLKTLEEPPEHVKFLLATTDPQKLPATILSRCLQFHLKPLHPEIILKHLIFILTAETISYEETALPIIAKAAQGSMRDALSLLDQTIATGQGQVTLTAIENNLGLTQVNYARQIIDALARRKAAALLEISQHIGKVGGNYAQILQDLMSELHELCIIQAIGEGHSLIQSDSDLIVASRRFSPEDTQLMYQIALKGSQDLLIAPTPMIGFEMTLLRMHTFMPAVKVDFTEVSVSIDTTPFDESKPPAKDFIELQESPPQELAVENEWLAEPERRSEAYTPGYENSSPDRQTSEKNMVQTTPHPPVGHLLPNHGESSGIALMEQVVSTTVELPILEEFSTETLFDYSSLLDEHLPIDEIANLPAPSPPSWSELITKLNLTGLALSAVENATLIELNDTQLVLGILEAHHSLFTSTTIKKIEQSLAQTYHRPVKLKLQMNAKVEHTPAHEKIQKIEEERLKAEEFLKNDPAFQKLQQAFSAEILKDSVELIKDEL